MDDSEDFRETYRDVQEDLPFDIPEPRGLPVTTSGFADASFGTNCKTRRSHSGYLLFVKRAPILWYSKKQSMIEDSAFSAEFIALKVYTEAVKNLRFKLRSFGIPLMHKDGIDHGTYVYCDNQSVINNTKKVESVLNKNSCSVPYHYVRSAIAANISIMAWIETVLNTADIFTKSLPTQTRNYLLSEFTYKRRHVINIPYLPGTK